LGLPIKNGPSRRRGALGRRGLCEFQGNIQDGKNLRIFFIIERDPCKKFGTLRRRLHLYFGMETALPAPSYGGNLKIALDKMLTFLRSGVATCILNNFI
jgi:hypothetical protein